MEVTINQEQQLFVIPAGDGYYSCRGFGNLFRELKQLLAHLGLKDPRADESKFGTLEQYQAYRDAIGETAKRGGFSETWFHSETPEAVRRVLEKARRDGAIVRIFTGDTETGRDWCEENDVIGKIGRSTGLLKVPLLVAAGEYGGGALLDSRILKIQRVSDGKVLYQHELYQAPNLEVRAYTTRHRGKTYTHEVWRDGELMARFTSQGKAAQYVAFMHGECFRQPS